MAILKTSQAVFVIAVALYWMSNGSDALTININTEKSSATMENVIHIACAPDSGDDMKKEIALLEITKNNGQLMVALRPCSNFTYGSDVANRIQVSGYIDEDVRKSYLNMNLTSTLSQDSGIYTCSMHYLEGAVLKEDRKSQNLAVENLTFSKLETNLNSLKERLKAVEEDGMKNVMERIKNLENTVTFNSAFSARSSSGIVFLIKNTALDFPHVIMSQGEGYDPKTGIFTAPRAGLYFFNLVVLTWRGKYAILSLKANEQVLARMHLTEETNGDQSSISAVTQLAVGDVVKVVTTRVGVSSMMMGNKFGLFSGYFLRPVNLNKTTTTTTTTSTTEKQLVN